MSADQCGGGVDDGKPRSGGRVWMGRLCVGGLICLALAWWVVYLFVDGWWVADVALNGSVFLGVGLVVVGGVRVVCKRSLGSLIVWGLCWSVLVMCMDGRRLMPLGGEAGDVGAGYVRVVSLNLYIANADPGALMGFLETLDDDVVVLVEPQWDVFAALLDGRDRLTRYPNREYRRLDHAHTPPIFILSRWGIVRDIVVGTRDGLSVVIDRPVSLGGPFRVVGVYAQSPRTQERWEMGNVVISGLAGSVGRLERDDGLPLVIAGDLNGGPMTGRDRELRARLGVRRTSAIFDPKSTFPSNLSMFGLLIDDIWVGDGIEAVSWSTVVIPGSDHRGVRGGLVVGSPSGQ